MNIIELLWDSKILPKSTDTIELPRGYIINAIRIHAPKAMQNAHTEILVDGRSVVDGRLWWFEGGLIPLDIDTSRYEMIELKITNRTTRTHKIEVILARNDKVSC